MIWSGIFIHSLSDKKFVLSSTSIYSQSFLESLNVFDVNLIMYNDPSTRPSDWPTLIRYPRSYPVRVSTVDFSSWRRGQPPPFVCLFAFDEEREKRVCQYAVLHRSHLTVHLFFTNFNEWIIKKKIPQAMKSVFCTWKISFSISSLFLCSNGFVSHSVGERERERGREKENAKDEAIG